MALTKLQKAFAREMAKGKRQGQAARDAGYAESTADNMASENMKNKEILDYIDELQSVKDSLIRMRFKGVADIALQELVNVLLDDDTPPHVKKDTAKILLDYAGHKPIDKQETTLSGDLDISQRADLVEKYLGGDEG